MDAFESRLVERYDGRDDVPPGLAKLMFDFAVAAVSELPTDIELFAVDYFTSLRYQRDSSSTSYAVEEYRVTKQDITATTAAPRQQPPRSSNDVGRHRQSDTVKPPSPVYELPPGNDESNKKLMLEIPGNGREGRTSVSSNKRVPDSQIRNQRMTLDIPGTGREVRTSFSSNIGITESQRRNQVRTPNASKTSLTADYSSDDDGHERPSARKYSIRRNCVSAERYDPEADDGDANMKVIHPKSDAQRRRLNENVRNILLFRALDEAQLLEVIDAMFERKVQPSDHVIREGDDGDNFYVIESGKFDIMVKNKKVGSYKDSGSFGELALMYNQPRAATIVARSSGLLWALDRSTFRRIVLKAAFNRRKAHEALLESVPVLKSLSNVERMGVVDALSSRRYNDGDRIIRQGDGADCMFFVEDGEVSIKLKLPSSRESEKEITRIKKGGYFGELALVTHKPRAASAYAVGPVMCAVLDISAFERLLGPCVDIMKRNINAYDRQLQQIFGSAAAATLSS